MKNVVFKFISIVFFSLGVFNIANADNKSRYIDVSSDELASFVQIENKNLFCYLKKPYKIKTRGSKTLAISIEHKLKKRITKLKRSGSNSKVSKLKKQLNRLKTKCSSTENSDTPIKSKSSNDSGSDNLNLMYSSFLGKDLRKSLDRGLKEDPRCMKTDIAHTTLGRYQNKDAIYIIAYKSQYNLDRFGCRYPDYANAGFTDPSREAIDSFSRIYVLTDNGRKLVATRDFRPSDTPVTQAREYNRGYRFSSSTINDIAYDYKNNQVIVAGSFGLEAFSSDLKQSKWKYRDHPVRKIRASRRETDRLIASFGIKNGSWHGTGRIGIIDTSSGNARATANLEQIVSDVAISDTGDKFHLVGRKSIPTENIETDDFKLNIENSDNSFEIPYLYTFNTSAFIGNNNTPSATVWGFSADDIRRSRRNDLGQAYLNKVEVGRDGYIYVLGGTDNNSRHSLFHWDGPNLSRRNNIVQINKGDASYNDVSEISKDERTIFYAKISPNGHNIIRGQFLISKDKNGNPSSITPYSLEVDRDTDTILITGYPKGRIDNSISTINDKPLEYINPRDDFYMTIDNNFEKRHIWSVLRTQSSNTLLRFTDVQIKNNKVFIIGRTRGSFYRRRRVGNTIETTLLEDSFYLTNSANDKKPFEQADHRFFNQFISVFGAKPN